MSNQQWWSDLCKQLSSELNGLQVGVYASGGAPYHHLSLAALWGADPRPIRAEDIAAGMLDNLDVLIFPGGGFKAMSGMLEPLGIDGATKVRHWVAQGGMYLGACAGSFLPAHVGEAYWQAHEEARALYMVSACLANSNDSMFEGLTSPGVGTLRAKLDKPQHWLAQGLPESFEIVHYNGPLFDLETELGGLGVSRPEGIVKPVEATSTFTPSEGFLGEPPQETLLDRCIVRGAFNGIVSAFGAGQVVLFGSHPEFGFDAIQLGWKPAVTLLGNALKFQATMRKSQPEAQPEPSSFRELLKDNAERLLRIAQGFHDLHKADTNGWLEGKVPSFLGRNAASLWLEATDRASQVATATARLNQELSHVDNLSIHAYWLDNQARDNQDVGFMGLKQLILEIETQLELAAKQLRTPPVTLQHAYDGFGVHPYQIAASSYLSAAGLTAAAYLMAVTIARLSQKAEFISYDLLLA